LRVGGLDGAGSTLWRFRHTSPVCLRARSCRSVGTRIPQKAGKQPNLFDAGLSKRLCGGDTAFVSAIGGLALEFHERTAECRTRGFRWILRLYDSRLFVLVRVEIRLADRFDNDTARVVVWKAFNKAKSPDHVRALAGRSFWFCAEVLQLF